MTGAGEQGFEEDGDAVAWMGADGRSVGNIKRPSSRRPFSNSFGTT
jgi:hypothetical protein